jgi:hypothetical protein
MGTRPHVLIVTEDSAKLNRWAVWLESEGYEVSSCPGPHVTGRCPRQAGVASSLREAADIAVVDVHPIGSSELYGGWAERSCTKIPDDCRTVFVHEPRLGVSFREDGIQVSDRVTKFSLLSAVRKVRRIFLSAASST